MRQIVLKETDGGRRIVRSVVSILEGNAPNCTPWHQLEAAKLLLKLGFEDARETLGSIHKQGRKDAPKSQDLAQTELGSVSEQPLNPEQIKLNKKLVRHIRVDTGDGTSMVKFLIDVVDGNEPDARVRDRIEAAKVLLHLCFDNPAQPDPEFMMYYAPCHPDCLCVCKDLPKDHPEVVQAHTPPTDEQREQWAKEQAQQEEWDRRTDELIERKMRADKQWKLEQFHDPGAVADRRIEREEQRKRRQLKREREKEGQRDLRERISRESRFDTWQYHQQQQDRQRARSP